MLPKLLDLKDIHEPLPIGWWPPAIGWWLSLLLILTMIASSIWLYKRITRKTAVKTARQHLLQIKKDATLDGIATISRLSQLLRRVAISVSANRAEAAGLVGQQWLAFLDQSMTGNPFTKGVGQLLIKIPYQKTPPTDQEINQLIALCEHWLNYQAKRRVS